MDEEDRKLIREHSRLIKGLQEDFQKFYKVVKYLIPEIEHTKTVNRKLQEFEEFKKRNPPTA